MKYTSEWEAENHIKEYQKDPTGTTKPDNLELILFLLGRIQDLEYALQDFRTEIERLGVENYRR